jgi:hypothetical protein
MNRAAKSKNEEVADIAEKNSRLYTGHAKKNSITNQNQTVVEQTRRR